MLIFAEKTFFLSTFTHGDYTCMEIKDFTLTLSSGDVELIKSALGETKLKESLQTYLKIEKQVFDQKSSPVMAEGVKNA